MGEERKLYYVWSDGEKQCAEDNDTPYCWKSDDYLSVMLTEEQADIMTYDEMISALKS